MRQNFNVPVYALTHIKACVAYLYRSRVNLVSKSFAASECGVDILRMQSTRPHGFVSISFDEKNFWMTRVMTLSTQQVGWNLAVLMDMGSTDQVTVHSLIKSNVWCTRKCMSLHVKSCLLKELNQGT